MSSREKILANVRAQLAGVAPEPAARAESGAPRLAPGLAPADALAAFRTQLESVAGVCTVLASEAELAPAVVALLRASGAASVVLSDAELIAGLAPALAPHVEVHSSPCERSVLLAADWGISAVQWAVAETGTCVLTSDSESHRLVSLVPTRHLAVLRADCILPDLGALLAELHTSEPAAMHRTVSLITGPSRTADIELSLVLGVHGPSELHVLILPPA